jgi:hypothetical protein
VTDTSGHRWFFANLAQVKLSRAATGGAVAIVELTGPPGDMPPLHLHPDGHRSLVRARRRDELPCPRRGSGSRLGGRGRIRPEGRSAYLSRRVDDPGALARCLHARGLRTVRRRGKPAGRACRASASTCSAQRGRNRSDYGPRRSARDRTARAARRPSQLSVTRGSTALRECSGMSPERSAKAQTLMGPWTATPPGCSPSQRTSTWR